MVVLDAGKEKKKSWRLQNHLNVDTLFFNGKKVAYNS